GSLGLSVAGAESNVAIGLARLGHRVRWAGRVGADELGALVLRTRAEGIDTEHVITDDTGRPTGLPLTELRLGTLTRVSYYRAGSAVTPADVLPALASGSRILHLTGITPALGLSAASRCASNVNYRSRLWTADRARTVLRPMPAHTDLLVASEDELPLVLERPDAGESEAVHDILSAGVDEVVVKRGARGATSFTADGPTDCPARQVEAVDQNRRAQAELGRWSRGRAAVGRPRGGETQAGEPVTALPDLVT
ncbi:sugar kinase, partial [Streptomyces sp. NPDC057474]|uniref:sugar kinase n=1 Tax=Streptomyces sp. NPDC057474 TaxID=3346144 RepID=UPI0036938869